MRNFSVSEIDRLRRTAKEISRNQNITHTAALDRLANGLGFNNWALLQKSTSTNPVRPPLFKRTIEETRESFRKKNSLMTSSLDEKFRNAIPDLSNKFISPMNALRYAHDYITTALSLPRYNPSRFSVAYFEMRIYLPYTFEPLRDQTDRYVILGRDYKPLGMTQKHERVEYEKYTNLHVRISKKDLENATRHVKYSPGWLYGDGNSPWLNRKSAEAYLNQLSSLTELVARGL